MGSAWPAIAAHETGFTEQGATQVSACLAPPEFHRQRTNSQVDQVAARGPQPANRADKPWTNTLEIGNVIGLILSALQFLQLKGGSRMSGGIVAVTSLALEARIALGPGVSVICSQGPRLAAHLEAALKRGVSGIISFGIAGGLAPGLVAGQWVAAAAITTAQQWFPTDRAWTRCLLERLPGAVHADIVGIDAPVADPADKRSLHADGRGRSRHRVAHCGCNR